MIRAARFLSRFKLFRFFISGGTAASISIGIVFVMTHIYTYHYLAATTVAFFCAVTVNFLLQKLWTFRENSLRRAHHQTVAFFAINGINFLLNAGLMVVFVEHLSLWPTLAQMCASALIACESFFAYSLVFNRLVPSRSLSLSGKNEIVHAELERAHIEV